MMVLDRIISELRAERRLINEIIYLLERLDRLRVGTDIGDLPTLKSVNPSLGLLVLERKDRQRMS
jgi:hypothetical protein